MWDNYCLLQQCSNMLPENNAVSMLYFQTYTTEARCYEATVSTNTITCQHTGNQVKFPVPNRPEHLNATIDRQQHLCMANIACSVCNKHTVNNYTNTMLKILLKQVKSQLHKKNSHFPQVWITSQITYFI